MSTCTEAAEAKRKAEVERAAAEKAAQEKGEFVARVFTSVWLLISSNLTFRVDVW